MNDPTVLDLLKSLFIKEKRISLSSIFSDGKEDINKKKIEEKKYSHQKGKFKKLLIPGISLALSGQLLLEPPQDKLFIPIILYAVSFCFLFLYIKNNNLGAIVETEPLLKPASEFNINLWFFYPGLVLLAFAFINFGDNQFTLLNTSLWIFGLILFVISVWQPDEKREIKPVSPNLFFILVWTVILVSGFYRFYLLNQVPGEMFSDHAEKLLDVMDVLNGKSPIFFTRNTGREAIQFYFTAAIIKLFGTGVTFTSLKIGTTFLGFLTLPFIFLLGRLISNKWVGLTAAFFAGIAYWPNVISRVGLRFPLYPLFTAAALFFLFKGLKERKYNLLIFSGLSIGLGLHGYSSFRIVPILVFIIIMIFIFYEKTKLDRKFAFSGFLVIAFTAFILFLPLFRYALENPGGFNSRALSRLTSVESSIDGSVSVIFFSNLFKSLVMFFYRNGVVWVNSIPNRPALDVVSAVFFMFGLLIMGKNAIRQKSWQSICLLISIPVLMLPSVLSLAFPQENPALNRSGGAIVIMFIITGMGFYHFAKILIYLGQNLFSKLAGIILVSALLLTSMIQNYDLVFNQYANQFLSNAWNSSEMGEVIDHFVKLGNSADNAFVVPYPHWVDTRLVGIIAGFPHKDYALWIEDFESTQKLTGAKIYLIKPEDREALDKLKSIYPLGEEEFFYSKTLGKNFIIFSVKT